MPSPEVWVYRVVFMQNMTSNCHSLLLALKYQK